MLRRRHFLAGSAAAIAAAHPARAQGWSPDRSVRMMVGFSPGGATDTCARVIAQAVAPALGQQMLIENRTGATGNIASEAVARAQPDGYTLLMGGQTTHVLNPLLFQNLTFHVQRDFTPVSMVAFADVLLVVHPSVQARTVPELVALAKARPSALNAGTAGSGSTQHLAAALFERQAGVQFTQVAFRGGAPAVQELVAGRIDLIFAPLVEALQQVRAGQARALGVGSPQPVPQLPDVPPIAATVPGFGFRSWLGVFGPAGMPPAATARYAAAITAAVRDPAVRERMVDLGFEPVGGPPEMLASLQAAELRGMAELIREAGITPQ